MLLLVNNKYKSCNLNITFDEQSFKLKNENFYEINKSTLNEDIINSKIYIEKKFLIFIYNKYKNNSENNNGENNNGNNNENNIKNKDKYVEFEFAIENKYISLYDMCKIVSGNYATNSLKKTSNFKKNGVWGNTYDVYDVVLRTTKKHPHIYINIDVIINICNNYIGNIFEYLLCLHNYKIKIPTCLKKVLFALSNIL